MWLDAVDFVVGRKNVASAESMNAIIVKWNPWTWMNDKKTFFGFASRIINGKSNHSHMSRNLINALQFLFFLHKMWFRSSFRSDQTDQKEIESSFSSFSHPWTHNKTKKVTKGNEVVEFNFFFILAVRKTHPASSIFNVHLISKEKNCSARKIYKIR